MKLEDYFEFEKIDDYDRIKIRGTRVAVEVLLEEFLRGLPPDQIQQSYPTVSREQVYATITYYLHNQHEMDEYLRLSRERAQGAYQQWLVTHQPSALEQRLRDLREASSSRGQPSP